MAIAAAPNALVVAICLGLALGCGDAPPAHLRVVHGAQSLGKISARVHGKVVVDQAAEGTISKYSNADSANGALIQIENPNDHAVITQTNASLAPGAHYSVIVTGSAAQPKLDVADDMDGYFRAVNDENTVVPLSISILQLPSKKVLLAQTLPTNSILQFKAPAQTAGIPITGYSVEFAGPNGVPAKASQFSSISNITVLVRNGPIAGEIIVTASISGADPVDM